MQGGQRNACSACSRHSVRAISGKEHLLCQQQQKCSFDPFFLLQLNGASISL